MTNVGAGASIFPAWMHRGGETIFDSAISLWRLDEASGVRADSIGSNDLTDNNTVGYQNLGPGGVVADFELADSENLSLAHSATFEPAGAYAFALWVKPESLPTHEWVLTKANALTTLGYSLAWASATSKWTFTQYPSTAVASAATETVAGQWRFLFFGFDGTNVFLKVDDLAVVETSGVAPLASAATLRLSGFSAGAGSNFFDGNIARVGFWSGSVPDPTTLYNSGKGKSYADLTDAEKVGLVSYWDLDEASGNRADSHGSNTLTDNNTVGSATNSYPANLPGRVASFVAANSESLSRVDGDLVDWPHADFHVAFWAKHPALGAEGTWFSKGTSAGDQREWRTYTAASQTRAYIAASSDGITEDVLQNTGDTSFPNNAWALVEVRRSGTTIGVAINGGAFQDGALSAVFNGTGALRLGARNTVAATFVDGQMSAAAIWSRVLTSDERDALYNSGDGAVLP